MARHSAEAISPTLRRDYDACRELIRGGSRSFHMASLLLPMAVRLDACALYAFCRLSDDAVDGPDARADAIERLQTRLDRIYEGRPEAIPADRAFADVVRRHQLPKALPAALLEGLAWDAAGFSVETEADLHAYAARVAGAVGAMMTVLMGVRDHDVLARATDLGVAMQLSNIARDVGEDARNRRLYLPRAWFAERGLCPEAWLASPRFDHNIAAMVERLISEADVLYRRSAGGVAGLPLACRPAIHAARLIYREIGEEVRRRGHDSVSSRAVVSGWRKVALLRKATMSAFSIGRDRPMPALEATRYLVDAVPAERTLRGFGLNEGVGRAIDIIGRMYERDRVRAAMARSNQPRRAN